MKKILKISLGLAMIFTLFGCSSSSKDVGKIIKDNGYTVQRNEYFEHIIKTQRSVVLTSSDKKIFVSGNFKKDKSFLGFDYCTNGKSYFTSKDIVGGRTVDNSLKTDYEHWLKEMDITEDELQKYLTDINNQTREPTDLQEIIDTVKFEAKFKEVTDTDYDDDLYLESKSKGVFMDAYIKDGKINKFIFADQTYGADKLFVLVNDKKFIEDGLTAYTIFLYNLNITHEEFMNYLESVYRENKS